MRKFLLLALAVALNPAIAFADPVAIVAAEIFFGDVAKQLGGADVNVTSILSNPDQDPHLFEASAPTARRISDPRIVIFNGAEYDPWMPKLLSASPRSKRKVIEVAVTLPLASHCRYRSLWACCSSTSIPPIPLKQPRYCLVTCLASARMRSGIWPGSLS